jgi:hypothetical protein
VKTGLTLGTKVEVLEGLAPDDRVATSALARLSDGAKVVVRSASSPSASSRETANAPREKRS